MSGCTAGKIVLTLEPGSVLDGIGSGPVGAISAHYVLYDRSAPVATAPKTAMQARAPLSAGLLSVLVPWTATDPGASGIRNYDIAQSTDGGAFVVVRSALPGASLARSLPPGHSYRFEVRASDKANNRGAWVAGTTLPFELVQQTGAIAYTGTWNSTTSAIYSGGTARYSGEAGASATYAFTGRGVAVFLTHGPTRGAVQVFVDGVPATTADLSAATATAATATFVRSFSSAGAHTIRLVVVGTAGHPYVVLDAFGVIH